MPTVTEYAFSLSHSIKHITYALLPSSLKLSHIIHKLHTIEEAGSTCSGSALLPDAASQAQVGLTYSPPLRLLCCCPGQAHYSLTRDPPHRARCLTQECIHSVGVADPPPRCPQQRGWTLLAYTLVRFGRWESRALCVMVPLLGIEARYGMVCRIWDIVAEMKAGHLIPYQGDNRRLLARDVCHGSCERVADIIYELGSKRPRDFSLASFPQPSG
ncbi:hypothetical protein Pfo_021660 [Paulownia fortunei]|nr:hypothetical protein Pfo_021660 [Paulownia fortunei]